MKHNSFRRSAPRVALASAISAGLVIALGACSNGGSTTSSEPLQPVATPTGTIRILDDNTNTSFDPAIIDDFEEQTGITVEYEQANFNDLHDRLATMFTAQDSSYDVVMTWAAWSAEFGQAGWLQPLDESAIPDDLLPAALDAVSYNDTVYGLPKFASAQTMYWNKDLFTQAGLDPETGPTTWDEFVADAKALTKDGRYGFAADMGNVDGAYQNFLKALLLNGGTMYNDDGTVAFNSPEGVEALTALSDLLNVDGVMDPSSLQITNSSDLSTKFANGDTGIVFNWPSQYAAIAAEGSAVPATSVGMGILPGMAVRSASIDGSEGFAINTYSKNKDAALAWLQFASAAEQQKQIVENEGWLPVSTSLLDDEALRAVQPVIPVYEEQAQYEIRRFGSPYYSDVTQVLSTAVTNVMLGNTDAQTALDDAATQAQTIVDRYTK